MYGRFFLEQSAGTSFMQQVYSCINQLSSRAHVFFRSRARILTTFVTCEPSIETSFFLRLIIPCSIRKRCFELCLCDLNRIKRLFGVDLYTLRSQGATFPYEYKVRNIVLFIG